MRVLFLATLALASCGKAEAGPAVPPVPAPVAPHGTIELTAKLLEVPGPFPANKLYDYVYVLKYKVLAVHRGKVEGSEILVGQYNPLKARAAAQDKFSGTIGGTAQHFLAGDVHRLSLEEPLDSAMPMVGLIDKYLKEKGMRYWAIWTDEARE
ncbi:MAG TPA: hypothetical protein VKW04_04630 [Planctomycetota bacterium]|nr:hypothetical protein [Planctomycetota bacterium]